MGVVAGVRSNRATVRPWGPAGATMGCNHLINERTAAARSYRVDSLYQISLDVELGLLVLAVEGAGNREFGTPGLAGAWGALGAPPP